MTITNSTLSGNSAGAGGGLFNDRGTLTTTNSIVANSPSGGNCSGTITSGGHNISSDGSCGFLATGDRNNTDPLLGPLQDKGGSTFTHALSEGSPAIDAGDNTKAPSLTDQRGLPRIVDGDCDLSSVVDIGSFELQKICDFPPAKASGGGQINGAQGGIANFGFTVQRDTTGGPVSGNFNYINHATSLHVNGPVTSLATFNGSTATFTGTCGSGTGPCTFTVMVQDNGEPGKNLDRFTVEVRDGWANITDWQSGPIDKGNIRVRNQ